MRYQLLGLYVNQLQSANLVDIVDNETDIFKEVKSTPAYLEADSIDIDITAGSLIEQINPSNKHISVFGLEIIASTVAVEVCRLFIYF